MGTPLFRRFLIVDDVTDSRSLLVRTLLRKFPNAAIQECQESVAAVAACGVHPFDIIIAHRSVDLDGITLVRVMRKVAPKTPIVMISGIDRTQQALQAGATAFHHYDEWLRIGTVVTQILEPQSSGDTANPFVARDPDDKASAPAV
jgi:CheY-like chemotaxis protein